MAIDEREIWACAHHIMQRYGDGARQHAQNRAATLDEAGDSEGQRTWLRILQRINDLDATVTTGLTN